MIPHARSERRPVPRFPDKWMSRHERLDETHAPGLRSWVASANGHADFPIQNLPFGVFSPRAGAPRGGIAIGDEILDLRSLSEAALLDGEAQAACSACLGPMLNRFLG